MATIFEYEGDGVTKRFSMSAPYIDVTHVKAYVGEPLVANNDFTYDTVTQEVVFTNAPAAPSVAGTKNVRVRRLTPDEPLVTFVTPGAILADNLNTMNLQQLYRLEEAEDEGTIDTGSVADGAITRPKLYSTLALQTARRYASVAAMKADTSLAVGERASTDGYYTAGDGGGADYAIVAAATGTDDGGLFLTLANTFQAKLLQREPLSVLLWGAVNDGGTNTVVALQAAVDGVASLGGGELLFPTGTYKVGDTLTVSDDVHLVGAGIDSTTINADDLFSTEDFIIYGDGVSKVVIQDMTIKSNLTSCTLDGINKYAVSLAGASDCALRRLYVTGTERGLIFRDGSSRCCIENCECYNVWEQGIGAIGASSSVCQFISIQGCKASTNMLTGNVASGLRFEEVYDSSMINCHSVQCKVGIRIENSCDNYISGCSASSCGACGLELYNFAQRNTVAGCSLFDNNTENYNDTDLTANKGNADTKLSGINIEGQSDNNCVIGNRCFQTSGGSGNQKYGIGVNIRNLTSGVDRYNVITGNQCFGNDLDGIQDRGQGTLVSDNQELNNNIIRNE